MVRREGETFISPTEETIPLEGERALLPPRFDEKSVQRAQPAVPLTRRAKARSWPTLMIVLCVVGGVAGGILGGLALTLYQRGGSGVGRTEQAARQEPAAVTVATPAGAEEVSPAEAQAGPAPTQDPVVEAREAAPAQGDAGAAVVEAGAQGELRSALGEWLAATNSRDVGRQMSFYAPRVEAFYLSRNASRDAVRAEKSRLFAQAASVNVEAAQPEIRMSSDGRTAVMRFRKRYRITGGDGSRNGEVLQELRWRRTDGGWKIVGERDLRVLQ